MKKIAVTVLALALSFAFFGCAKGGDKANGNANGNGGEGPAVEATDAKEDSKVGMSTSGDFVVFKVKSDIKLDENAWLGFCPGSKQYKNETEADEDDVLYMYQSADKTTNEAYVFEFDKNDIKSSLQDGEYVMVLCDNDDDGKLILQFPAVVKNGEATFDLSKIKMN